MKMKLDLLVIVGIRSALMGIGQAVFSRLDMRIEWTGWATFCILLFSSIYGGSPSEMQINSDLQKVGAMKLGC